MKKSIKNIFLLIPGALSQLIRNIILVFMINKFLGIKNAGIWGQIIALQGLLSIFINLNLSLSIARYFPAKKDNSFYISSRFYSLFIIQIFVMAISLLVICYYSNELESFLLKDSLPFFPFYMTLLVVSDMLFNNMIGLYRAIQQHLLQTYFLSLRMILELFILGGGIIYLNSIDKLSIEKIFYLYFFSVIITVIIGFIVAYKKGFLTVCFPVFKDVNKYLSFGLHQLPLSLSQWGLNLGDRVIVGSILGMEFLGIYFLANRVASLVNFFWGPVSQVLLTEGANLYDKKKGLKTIERISFLYIVLINFISLLIYFIFSYISDFFIKESLIREKVYQLLPFLLLAMILYNVLSIKIIFLQIKEKIKKIGKIWSFIIVFYLIYLLIFIKFLNIYATVSGLIISYLLGLFLIRKEKIV